MKLHDGCDIVRSVDKFWMYDHEKKLLWLFRIEQQGSANHMKRFLLVFFLLLHSVGGGRVLFKRRDL